MLQCELKLLENIGEDRAEECIHLARQLKMDCLVFRCLEVLYTKFTMPDFHIEQRQENMIVSNAINTLSAITGFDEEDREELLELPRLRPHF
ncbi:unnamed protein product [Bursaphelenchus okinawaensis]|uniref:Uncharacterized protein n=1 Tax=Bursaphelenchus okinawaensis TaxID=465554 RepID=A0A811JR23_9BILA|nr:unnamed protein product [Bursaphelenchus okinawaensis]CAG9079549.1 unnamed protein product [Bursaphelenchus okinawaensis]